MFVFEKFDGAVPGVRDALQPRDAAFVAAVDAVLAQYNAAMGAVHLKAGLRLVMEMSAEGNRYMQDTKPWDLLKAGAADRCATVITLVASLIRLLANVAEPFMPGFTDKVRRRRRRCRSPRAWHCCCCCCVGAPLPGPRPRRHPRRI